MSKKFIEYLNIIQERSEATNLITKALIVVLDDDKINFNKYMSFLNKLNEKNVDSSLISIGKAITHEVKTAKVNLKVRDLIPTQSEIDIDNSLAYPIDKINWDGAGGILKILTATGPISVANKSIITCGGKYIIDGHHRWSQVLLINPNAEISCIDIHLDSPLKTLKAIQLGIRMNKFSLPTASVKGSNLLNQTPESIKAWVENKLKAKKEIDDAFKAYSKAEWKSETKLGDFVAANSGLLKKLAANNPLKDSEIPRNIMPQTDNTEWATHIPYPDFNDSERNEYQNTKSVIDFIRTAKTGKTNYDGDNTTFKQTNEKAKQLKGEIGRNA